MRKSLRHGFSIKHGVGRATVTTPAMLSPLVWYEARRGGLIQAINGAGDAALLEDAPVGFIPDLSGNGKHLAGLANDTTRPTLKGVGTKPYLNFVAGSSQILTRAAALGAYAAGACTWAISFRAGAQSTHMRILSETRVGSDNTHYSLACVNSALASRTAASLTNDAAGVVVSIVGSLSSVVLNGSDHVYIVTDSGTQIKNYDDNAAGVTTEYTRSGVVTLDRFSLGGRRGATTGNFWTGRIYGVVVIGRVLSLAERNGLNNYMRGLAELAPPPTSPVQ